MRLYISFSMFSLSWPFTVRKTDSGCCGKLYRNVYKKQKTSCLAFRRSKFCEFNFFLPVCTIFWRVDKLWYVFYLRNRKHVPCFYRVIAEAQVEVWENKKCFGNMSHRGMFARLFQVLPNFHECFYNLIETWSTCFLFLLENTAARKRKTTC